MKRISEEVIFKQKLFESQNWFITIKRVVSQYELEINGKKVKGLKSTYEIWRECDVYSDRIASEHTSYSLMRLAEAMTNFHKHAKESGLYDELDKKDKQEIKSSVENSATENV